jgi:hypothetical protein
MVLEWCHTCVTMVLQRCYSGVTLRRMAVRGSSEPELSSFSGVTVVCNRVTLMYNSGVPVVSSWCYSGVPDCHRGVPVALEWCYSGVIMV